MNKDSTIPSLALSPTDRSHKLKIEDQQQLREGDTEDDDYAYKIQSPVKKPRIGTTAKALSRKIITKSNMTDTGDSTTRLEDSIN